MKKYSYELKLKIVKEKEEGYGDRYLAKKYKYPYKNIDFRSNKNVSF